MAQDINVPGPKRPGSKWPRPYMAPGTYKPYAGDAFLFPSLGSRSLKGPGHKWPPL